VDFSPTLLFGDDLMPNFSSLKELEKYLLKTVENAMNKEVADAVKDYIVMSVDENVYSVYEPKQYERRGLGYNSEGIGGKKNMKHVVTTKGNSVEVKVTDEAKGETGFEYLAELIEYGDKMYGGMYSYDYPYPPDARFLKPRPFMEKAKENLERDKYHVERLKEGLERQGLQVE